MNDVCFEGWLLEQFNAPVLYPDDPTVPNIGTNYVYPGDAGVCDDAAAGGYICWSPQNPATSCTNNSPSTCNRDNYTAYQLQNQFFVNALTGADQLRQRVAWALTQIDVVSEIDVIQPASWMTPYVQLFDRDALGNYRKLLYDLTVNPAMGQYLNMRGNTRTNVNENYAREILQLFSVGLNQLNPDGTPQLDDSGNPIPTYDQDTITNLARVFTGWNLDAQIAPGVPNYRDPMIVTSGHDTQPKTLFGQTINDDTASELNEALDIIFSQPNLGPFIGKQLIEKLVTSNPSPTYVGNVTAAFNTGTYVGPAGNAFGSGSRGDMQAVVAAVLLDPEARTAPADPNYGHLREPVLFITNTLRTLDGVVDVNGSPTTDFVLGEQFLPSGANTNVRMDQDVFRPPTVFSYYSPDNRLAGSTLIAPEFAIQSTSTSLAHINIVYDLAYHRLPIDVRNRPLGTWIDTTQFEPEAGVDTGPDPNLDNNSATAVTSVVAVGGIPVDVAQHHLHPTRDAAYVDPLITQAAAMTVHRDLSFNGSLTGQQIHAQPLYVNSGPNGAAAFVVATEQNNIVVLDAEDGSTIWLKNLGAPVPGSSLLCGDIDPLGITGTPVIDLSARVVFVDAMTTSDGGATKQHLIFALSLDDGSVIDGWPVDVNALSFGSLPFDSSVQNQRGALLLNAGVLYVPYGGHFGDCANYHGWVVAVPEFSPSAATAWATDGLKAGIWAVGGLTTDGNSIFAATGNTAGATDWMGGEAILRLGLDGTFSHNPADFFTPSNWFTLDQGDLDLGGEAPLIVDVPGATPAQLVVALGKSGVAHLLDRNNLGGIGTGDGVNGEGLFSTKVATEADPSRGRIRTAAAAYTTASGTYVVFSVSTTGATGFVCPGTPGDLVALRISASSPPTISVAWCADNHGRGAPIVTTTDGLSEPVVWTIGAEGTNRLYAYNGETGDLLFDGGGSAELMTFVQRFSTPIAVNGRIIVAADGRLFVFTTQ